MNYEFIIKNHLHSPHCVSDFDIDKIAEGTGLSREEIEIPNS